MAFDLQRWARPRRDRVDAFLAERFCDAWPPRFQAACRYPLSTGGKRLRPLLTIAAGEAIGGDRAALVATGAAVELVHTYSLVHDDLPAMDDDVERRGKATVHIAFGEGTAILVGDALLTDAFAVLGQLALPPETRVRLILELARAAGHPGMVGGQAADIGLGGPVVDLPTLLAVHRGKTGALIRAAAVMGAIASGANASQIDRVAAYGAALGLAFQLADDILDQDEDAGEGGPPSTVALLGLEETRRRAHQLASDAESAAQQLPSPAALVALAHFSVQRDN